MRSGLYHIKVSCSLENINEVSDIVLIGNGGMSFAKMEYISDCPVATEGCDYRSESNAAKGELIETCKNCLHIGACKQWYPKLPDKYHDGCEHFMDKSSTL